jgi:hypothetical protein
VWALKNNFFEKEPSINMWKNQIRFAKTKRWCVGGKIVGLNNLNGHVANPHSRFLKEMGRRA